MPPNERIYLIDDPDMGVVAETRQPVIDRHIGRYMTAMELAGRTGGTWLDCACGSGYGTRLIADLAVPDLVWGMDASHDAIAYAERHYSGRGCEFSTKCFPTGINVAVSIETLEHVSARRQPGFIDILASAVRPSGVLVLACPLGNGANPWNPHHVHEPTRSELKALLGRRFASVQITTEEYESTSGPAVQAWAVCRGVN